MLNSCCLCCLSLFALFPLFCREAQPTKWLGKVLKCMSLEKRCTMPKASKPLSIMHYALMKLPKHRDKKECSALMPSTLIVHYALINF